MKTLTDDEYSALVDAQAERDRLFELVNNPQTAAFLSAVQAEAAHQVQRWGEAHDRSKSADQWYWLIGYLAGKCLRASIDGDKQKALHHTISTAAALAQWHKAIAADTSGCGAGENADMQLIETSAPPRVRHVKRGSVYDVLGEFELQSSGGPVEEGDTITVYRGIDDGKTWARPTPEFNDGRFVPVADEPSPEIFPDRSRV